VTRIKRLFVGGSLGNEHLTAVPAADQLHDRASAHVGLDGE
jgi:hypothetical protein